MARFVVCHFNPCCHKQQYSEPRTIVQGEHRRTNRSGVLPELLVTTVVEVIFRILQTQVIYTSMELSREVQRVTVDASANVSEVRK